MKNKSNVFSSLSGVIHSWWELGAPSSDESRVDSD